MNTRFGRVPAVQMPQTIDTARHTACALIATMAQCDHRLNVVRPHQVSASAAARPARLRPPLSPNGDGKRYSRVWRRQLVAKILGIDCEVR